jgi:hypothetical protein
MMICTMYLFVTHVFDYLCMPQLLCAQVDVHISYATRGLSSSISLFDNMMLN